MRIILNVGSHNLLLPEEVNLAELLVITQSEFVERGYGSAGKWRKGASETSIEFKVVSDESILTPEQE